MLTITIRELKGATVDKLHSWLPCVVVADGIPVCAIVAHDGGHREDRRAEATHDGGHRNVASARGSAMRGAHGRAGAHLEAGCSLRPAAPAGADDLPLSKKLQAQGRMGSTAWGITHANDGKVDHA